MSDPAPYLLDIESRGYATSVHRMGEYVEPHAVKLPAGEPVHIERVIGGVSDAEVMRAAFELACMCAHD